ncbi:MAG: hypothetical protein L0Y74_04315 [candidate division Zixibacteria bacterium]|nr:hypothetical protein [candidate division Zixibacteria bacterium]
MVAVRGIVLILLLAPHLQAGVIKDFKLEAFFLQHVGVSFPLSVTDAVDDSGNSASGVVQVRIKGGSGISPEGYPPILNPITVTNGTGSAFQVLTNVAPTIFEGVIDTVVRSSSSVFVTSGDIHHFNMTLATPQTSGQSFSSPSVLTAKDLYGNQVVNYDAATDSVSIHASDSGLLTNNILNKTPDFQLGVCDLSSQDLTYTGRGGYLYLTATSSSGKTGQSNQILVRSLRVDDIDGSPDILEPLDTLMVSVKVFNTADVSGIVTDLSVLYNRSGVPVILNKPMLPDTLPANSSFDYQFRGVIPSNYSSGDLGIAAKLSGIFNGHVVTDSTDFLDTVDISKSVNLQYVAGSLEPSQVSKEVSTSNFSLKVVNNSSFLVVLDTNSILTLGNLGLEQASLKLDNQVVVTAAGTQASLTFASSDRIDLSQFQEGPQPVRLSLTGTKDGGAPYEDILFLADSVEISSLGEDIAVFPNPFNPDLGTVKFSLQHVNESPVSLRIFTLTGEKVLSVELAENTSFYEWNGTNSDGKKVLPGVYLVFLKVKDGGKEYKLRVGLVR